MLYKCVLLVNEECKFKSNTSVIDCITQQGYKLYYSYDDIFKYLEDRSDLFGDRFSFVDDKKETYKKEFLSNYIENINNNDNYTCAIKLLVDTFMYQPINTVFCFYDGTNGTFNISKGNKKVIAFDILGFTHAHILVVSKDNLSNPINSDEELYWLLRKIDPTAHRFEIVLDKVDIFPQIHYAESVATIGKWSKMTAEDNEIFKQTMPTLPARVKFMGLSYTTDERIVSCCDDYYCCVYSNKFVDISLDYLYLCSSNIFYKQKTRIGTTRDNSIKIEYGWTNPYPAGYADFFIPNP